MYKTGITKKDFWFSRVKPRKGGNRWPFSNSSYVEDLTRVIPETYYGESFQNAKTCSMARFKSVIKEPTIIKKLEQGELDLQEREFYALLANGFNTNTILGKLRDAEINQAAVRPKLVVAPHLKTPATDMWAELGFNEPVITPEEFVRLAKIERQLLNPEFVALDLQEAKADENLGYLPPKLENDRDINSISHLNEIENFDKFIANVAKHARIEIKADESLSANDTKLTAKKYYGPLNTIKKYFSLNNNSMSKTGWPTRFTLRYPAGNTKAEQVYAVIKRLSAISVDNFAELTARTINLSHPTNLPTFGQFERDRNLIVNAAACLVASDLCHMIGLSRNDAKVFSETFKLEATQYLERLPEQSSKQIMPLIADYHAIAINNFAEDFGVTINQYATSRGIDVGDAMSFSGVLYANAVPRVARVTENAYDLSGMAEALDRFKEAARAGRDLSSEQGAENSKELVQNLGNATSGAYEASIVPLGMLNPMLRSVFGKVQNGQIVPLEENDELYFTADPVVQNDDFDVAVLNNKAQNVVYTSQFKENTPDGTIVVPDNVKLEDVRRKNGRVVFVDEAGTLAQIYPLYIDYMELPRAEQPLQIEQPLQNEQTKSDLPPFIPPYKNETDLTEQNNDKLEELARQFREGETKVEEAQQQTASDLDVNFVQEGEDTKALFANVFEQFENEQTEGVDIPTIVGAKEDIIMNEDGSLVMTNKKEVKTLTEEELKALESGKNIEDKEIDANVEEEWLDFANVVAENAEQNEAILQQQDFDSLPKNVQDVIDYQSPEVIRRRQEAEAKEAEEIVNKYQEQKEQEKQSKLDAVNKNFEKITKRYDGIDLRATEKSDEEILKDLTQRSKEIYYANKAKEEQVVSQQQEEVAQTVEQEQKTPKTYSTREFRKKLAKIAREREEREAKAVQNQVEPVQEVAETETTTSQEPKETEQTTLDAFDARREKIENEMYVEIEQDLIKNEKPTNPFVKFAGDIPTQFIGRQKGEKLAPKSVLSYCGDLLLDVTKTYASEHYKDVEKSTLISNKANDRKVKEEYLKEAKVSEEKGKVGAVCYVIMDNKLKKKTDTKHTPENFPTEFKSVDSCIEVVHDIAREIKNFRENNPSYVAKNFIKSSADAYYMSLAEKQQGVASQHMTKSQKVEMGKNIVIAGIKDRIYEILDDGVIGAKANETSACLSNIELGDVIKSSRSKDLKFVSTLDDFLDSDKSQSRQ